MAREKPVKRGSCRSGGCRFANRLIDQSYGKLKKDGDRFPNV